MRYVTLQLFLFFSQALGAKIHQVSWRSRRNASRIALSEGVDGSQRPPFEGIGALSAGASSRLLQDYPETQRNEILDLLFKPQYGASLQVLKVEIGGDTQSTDGSEPSHMRYRGERPDCSRGYEAWLLQEAKARNPLIRTYALAWGVPGWIGNGTFFSEDNIHYHVSWLKCIKERYDIDIDYMGLWNEMPWGDVWYVFDLASAIKDAELNTQLVLLDQASSTASADFLALFRRDERFQELVAAVGLHYPCVSDPKLLDALEAHPHTRFWSSEELSTVADWGGAGCWGRMINQNYVRMKATSSIAWSLVWSVYPNLECFGNGLLYAYEPWSGHYEVMAPLWTSAHTTQFTKLGWNYLPVGDAAGILPEGGTYVTIASSDLSDFTIVIETLTGRCMYHDGCFHTKTPQEVQHLEFQLSDNLTAAARGRDLEVWVTNASHWFRRLEDLRVDEGIVRISMEVDAILTISTLQEATKQGQRASTPKDTPEIPQQAAFPLPFEEAFDAVQLHRSPPFFADQGGTFEVVEDMDLVRGTRLNRVLQQQVLQVPIGWSGAAPEPLTLFGGTNWTDVNVEVLARFEGPTSGKFTPLQPFGHQSVHLSLLEEGKKRSPKARYVGLCARVLRYTFFNTGGKPQGYCLQVTEDGLGAMWTLTASSEVLAAGPLSETSKEKIARKEWLQLRLEVSKARIRALIDGETVSNIIDTSLPMGQVALNCGYHKCQFDNIKVLPSSKNVTSFLATTSRELLKMYSPVTFHYDARTCDPSPAQTPKRDDFTGFVGLAFVPQVAVRLAALGRMVLRGGPPVAAVHNVELLEVDGKQLKYVASAAVPTTPSQQVGIIATDEGFQYAELRESVLLEPGHKYVLASSEISGGDFFYDKAVVAEASEGVQILGPAYSNQSGWTFDSEPNLLFGPLNALLIPAEAQTQQLFTPVADPEKAKHAASGPAFVMKSQESKATSTAEAEAEDGASPATPQWEVELVEDQTLSTLDLSPS